MTLEIELSDNSGIDVLPVLNVPLTEETLENAIDVTTLDYNVYTDFINYKRQWTHTWAYLTEEQYELIRGYYERQFTYFEYPRLTIAYYGIYSIPVRMSLNPKTIINDCGMVRDVTITLRETGNQTAVS